MMQLFFQSFENSQKMMKSYLIMTFLCTFLDFVGAAIILQHYGNPGEEDAEVILLLLCVTFFVCNAKWISFLFQIQDKFPRYISILIHDAILGLGDKINTKMSQVGKVVDKKARATGTAFKRGIRDSQLNAPANVVGGFTAPR